MLTGSCTAVSAGGGKFQNVVWLGRVMVAVVEHPHIMEKWIDETIKNVGYDFGNIVEGVETRMADYSPEQGEEGTQFDVFSAVVINRMENDVFVHKRPSSFLIS